MNTSKQDAEFDLIELLLSLWAGKWVILTFVFASFLFGFTFSYYKKKSLPEPHFWVLAPYKVNLFRPLHSQICGDQFYVDRGCAKERMSTELESLAQDQWTRNRLIEEEWMSAGLNFGASQLNCPEDYFCLEINTRSPLDLKTYNLQLENFNKILTDSIIEDLKAELSYQFDKSTNFILASEAYAENILKLTQLLSGIERGQMAINFGAVEVKKVMPPHKQKIIIILSLLLGGGLGCVTVLTKSAISKRLFLP